MRRPVSFVWAVGLEVRHELLNRLHEVLGGHLADGDNYLFCRRRFVSCSLCAALGIIGD